MPCAECFTSVLLAFLLFVVQNSWVTDKSVARINLPIIIGSTYE